MTVHFANLTNGIICAPQNYRFVRIPSTWCEQKRWDRVLYGAGPELLLLAAAGHEIVVHDQSERQRMTRAQWQGLSWLRFACAAAWGLNPQREFSRNGMDVSSYWEAQYARLGDTDRSWLEYFGEAAVGLERVSIRACDCPRVPWRYGDGKILMRGLSG